MKNYFRLNSFVRFEKNCTEACVYNLATGDMMHLDDLKVDIIEKCECNKDISGFSNDEVSFLNKLEEMGIGKYYERKVCIDKMHLGFQVHNEKQSHIHGIIY